MTQAILNTLNTLEQATFAKKDLQKLSESVNSGMDKSSDFKKIFEKYGLYFELGNAWNLSCYEI